MNFLEAVKLVEREKIADYLLNARHPDNGGKAAFFEGLGFQRGDWEQLAIALKKLAERPENPRTIDSPHGQKYVIVGRIESPAGNAAMVQTIWIVDKGSSAARLVTAYPHQARMRQDDQRT